MASVYMILYVITTLSLAHFSRHDCLLAVVGLKTTETTHF